MNQEVIDLLKAREDSHGYIRMNSKRFTPGDTVSVTQGLFANLSAVFLTQEDGERAKILLEFMGREQILPIRLA